MTLLALLIGTFIVAAITQLTIDNRKKNRVLQVLFSGIALSISLLLFMAKSPAAIVIHLASWPAPYGIILVIDQLSKLMMLIFSIIFTCISIYSVSDKTLNKLHHIFYAGSWLLMLGVIGALTTYDIFNLYVWSEVILVSAFIILSISPINNHRNVWHYAVFNIVGTLIMLLAIALLYGITGNLNNAAIAEFLALHHSNLATAAVSLLLLGLIIKGGIFPFYFWLPDNYPATNTSATLLVSCTVTKVIMLVILRLVWLWYPLQHNSALTTTFIILACCTMFFGVMGAANEFRLRHIFSFHIISQLGYIFLALFIPSIQAIVAALYFLIHNMFVKTNLIMTSGIIEQEYKTNDLQKIGHVLKSCPLLAVIFFIAAMSLAGLPPFSGFWGKLLIFKSAIVSHNYIPLTIAIVVALFTLYSMLKVWRFVYCEKSANSSDKLHKVSLSKPQTISLTAMLAIPALFGIIPAILLTYLYPIANQLSHTQTMIQTILGVR